MTEEPKLSTTISFAHKVQPRQYESAEVFLSVSGITDETTREEIEALLDGPNKIAYGLIKKLVVKRTDKIREEF